jgi:uncharacterized damage-inducible protein DinB
LKQHRTNIDEEEEDLETPLQKFERLKVEVSQFLTEMDKLTKQTQPNLDQNNTNESKVRKQKLSVDYCLYVLSTNVTIFYVLEI